MTGAIEAKSKPSGPLVLRALGHVVYGSLWALGFAIAHVPFGLRRVVAQTLAWLWFYGLRFRRNVILHNLAVVFPRRSQESMGEFRVRCEVLARANMAHYVLCLIEILERFHWDSSVVGRKVAVEGLDRLNSVLQTAREQNRGAFFLTAHLGNWELITILGVFLKARLAIVTRYLRNGFFDRIWVRSRTRFGLELLEESGSGMAIVKSLKRGKTVGFIMDQHTGEPHGIEARFLGQTAWSPKGLAILATRTESPVVPAYLLRQNDGSFLLHVEAPLQFPRLEQRGTQFRTESGALTEAGLRYHIQVCNENMEKWIFRAPEQYLWLHKRFKTHVDYRAPLVWTV